MTINFTLLLFLFFINIYIQVNVTFSACVAIYGCCFCEYSCWWLLILLLYLGFGCNLIERFSVLVHSFLFLPFFYLNKNKNNATCCLFITVRFFFFWKPEMKKRQKRMCNRTSWNHPNPHPLLPEHPSPPSPVMLTTGCSGCLAVNPVTDRRYWLRLLKPAGLHRYT